MISLWQRLFLQLFVTCLAALQRFLMLCRFEVFWRCLQRLEVPKYLIQNDPTRSETFLLRHSLLDVCFRHADMEITQKHEELQQLD